MFEGMCNIEIQNTKILDIKINATILSTCLLVQYTSNGQVAPEKELWNGAKELISIFPFFNKNYLQRLIKRICLEYWLYNCNIS